MLKTVTKYILASLLLCYGLTHFPGPLKEDRAVVIPKENLLKISESLEQSGLVYNKLAFFVTSQIYKQISPLRAGEYTFPAGASIAKIVKILQYDTPIYHKVTVPEGYCTFQIMDLVNKDSNLIGASTRIYKEGELLPQTYYFVLGDSRDDVVNRMASAMQIALDRAWEARQSDIPVKSKYEMLIMASIVEKEAKFDDEKPRIAAVFLNRLKRGMKLEADPTTIYAITKGKYVLNRMLFYKDLKMLSPFNTYTVLGLPPTPIANPGVKAIEAVAHPAQSDDLYFVVKSCDGRHEFSSNMKNHVVNVRNYRKLRC